MSRIFLFLVLFLVFSIALAESLTEDETPEPLKPWVNWVLQDEEQYPCPFFYNNFQKKQCSWPGNLSLDLQPKKAQFISHWQVYNDSWITLPGNKDYWPQNVMVNNKPALVMNK